MSTQIAAYVMNPVTDMILFGDQLAEGMLALPESPALRHGDTEDEQLRAQRFRTVTALRTDPPSYGRPAQAAFIGEWIDGYQESWRGAITWGWIVRRDSILAAPESVPEPAPKRRRRWSR